MAEKRGRSHSLNSIFLEDYEENKELAESYVDLDGAAGGSFNDVESESVFMKKTEMEEELKRKEAISKLFADDEPQSPGRTHSSRVSHVSKPADSAVQKTSTKREPSARRKETQSGSEQRKTASVARDEGSKQRESASAEKKLAPIENPTSSPRLKNKSNTESRYTPTRSSVNQISRTSIKGPKTENADTGKKAASLRSIQNDGEYIRDDESRYNSRNKKKVQYEKPKTTGQKIAKFAVFFVLWGMVFIVCVVGYNFAYKLFDDKPMDSTDLSKIEVTLTGEETDEEVGEILKENGLIDDVDLFKLRCKIYDSKYYPGVWKLSRSYNTEKILNILAGYNYATGRMEEVTTAAEETSETSEETTAAEAAPEGGEAVEGEAALEGGDGAGDGEYVEGDGEYYEDGGEG